MILASLALMLQQSPQPATPVNPVAPATQRLGVEFDKNGWPVMAPARARSLEQRGDKDAGAVVKPIDGLDPAARMQPPATPTVETAPSVGAWSKAMAAVGSADSFRALGAMRILWRVRVVDSNGGTLGERSVRQISDAGMSDRERLEFDDGRVYARTEGSVLAERHGMPWPTLEASAARELSMFAMHAALPLQLMDPTLCVDGAKPRASAGEGTTVFSRLPRPAQDQVGPAEGTTPGESIELVVDNSTGLPREVVTAADLPMQRRRILLEDWRPFHGMQLPFRRVWLDANGKPTTVLEVLEIETGIRWTDGEFRLR